MPKAITVDAYMEALEHPLKAEVEAVRQMILKADRRMMERVKWNSPSFYYIADLGAFHLRATDFVHLILVWPKNSVIPPSDLFVAMHKDRREVKFYNMTDIKAKKKALVQVIKEWIEIVESRT